MTVVIQQPEEAVRVPEWVTDLASFRCWARSEDFPVHGWYSHLNGELWVDPSMERLAHNKVKTKIGAVLTLLAEKSKAGQFLGDRMLLTNLEAGLSTEPDGLFISHEALGKRHVWLEQGEESVEVQGGPDMVLEVISPTSVQKDTVVLRDLYWRAGVKEYWLADLREKNVELHILKYGPRGYTAARRQMGWLKSFVFGRSFRLTRDTDPSGYPLYNLDVR